MPEMQFKRALIAHARIDAGQRVLDLGSGTGTLAIMTKLAQPGAQVIGLDGDPEILSIAWEKASRTGVEIALHVGNVDALPFPDQSFDRILSTLVMSVLNSAEKRLAIREAHRVLVGGGELHIADFSSPTHGGGGWLPLWCAGSSLFPIIWMVFCQPCSKKRDLKISRRAHDLRLSLARSRFCRAKNLSGKYVQAF